MLGRKLGFIESLERPSIVIKKFDPECPALPVTTEIIARPNASKASEKHSSDGGNCATDTHPVQLLPHLKIVQGELIQRREVLHQHCPVAHSLPQRPQSVLPGPGGCAEGAIAARLGFRRHRIVLNFRCAGLQSAAAPNQATCRPCRSVPGQQP